MPGYSTEILKLVNTTQTIEQIARECTLSADELEAYIQHVFDMDPELVRDTYRRMTDIRSVELHQVRFSRVFFQHGISYLKRRPHHATREMCSRPYAVAWFWNWDRKISVRLMEDSRDWTIETPIYEFDIRNLKTSTDPSEEHYDVPVVFVSGDERKVVHIKVVYVKGVVEEAARWFVSYHNADGTPLNANATKLNIETEIEQDEYFFTPEYSFEYTCGRRPKEKNYPKIDNATSTEKEDPMSTKITPEIINDIAVLLVETKSTVRDILDELQIADHPKFYAEFRKTYGCTPTEYRTEAQTREAELTEDKTEETVPWDFTVLVSPESMHTGFGDPNGVAPPLNVDFKIPIMVNESYSFLVYLVNSAGTCPFHTNKDLMRSLYRDLMHDQTLEALKSYFHGRLDIAYFQVPVTNSSDNHRPQWPGPSPFSPGPGHGYPR